MSQMLEPNVKDKEQKIIKTVLAVHSLSTQERAEEWKQLCYIFMESEYQNRKKIEKWELKRDTSIVKFFFCIHALISFVFFGGISLFTMDSM